MRNSIPAIVISAILVFLGIIIMPMYFMGIITWRDDMNAAMVASRNLVDSIIDTGEISDDMANDFALTLAACDMGFTYKIEREVKDAEGVGEPLVMNPPGTVSEYVYENVAISYYYVDDVSHFDEGDIVTVTVTPTRYSAWQRIAMLMLGSTFSNDEIRYSAMVRN